MSVEVRHLRALVALAEADTFTTAAAVLRTTQPTLSRTISQLEELVGTRLVERTTREMSFTPAGVRFAESARGLLAGLDAAVAGVHETEPSPLRLGWAWAGFGRHTVPLLQRWRQEHGGLLEFSRPEDPLEALRSGAIDAALLRSSPPSAGAGAGFSTMPLFVERLVAAVASDDPRARQASVTLAGLATGPVAVCATAPTATAHLWGSERAAPETITVANTDEWLTRIAIGDAVGVTADATTYSHHAPEVTYLPIDDAPPVAVVLAWEQANGHPEAPVFADFARAYFTGLAEASTPPWVLSAAEDPRAERR